MKKILSLILLTTLPIHIYAQTRSAGETLFATLLIILLFIGIFLICRGIVNWYYKINQRVKNQERIIELLESIEKKLDKAE